MTNETNSTLAQARWHRLSLQLLNIRAVPSQTPPPVCIVQAMIEQANESFRAKSSPGSEPLVIFHLKGRHHTYRLQQGDRLDLDILLFQFSQELAVQWKDAFIERLLNAPEPRNFQLLQTPVPEERTIENLVRELGFHKTAGEICLDFLCPLAFKPPLRRPRTYIDKQMFIRHLESRFTRLLHSNICYHSDSDRFDLLPFYWKYCEVQHPSGSEPGTTQYINGCFGPLYLKGEFKDFLPFLIVGSELHAGTKLSNSQGFYSLVESPSGYFEKFFPNQKALIPVIADVLERYDHVEQGSDEMLRIHSDQAGYATELTRELNEERYTLSPSSAFEIRKKDGSVRLLERSALRDLIIQHYLLKTISAIFDRFFEESSIGYRRGKSRQTAIQMVESALAEGYHCVIESDIDDFFPSVDYGRLAHLLEFYLPEKDALIRKLLLRCVQNSYVLNGALHNRTQGLPQGNPLSPLLANLYLDSFDEQVAQWNVRIIRYADDFIILTKSEEEAHAILAKTEGLVSSMGLKLSREKTAIRDIQEGFEFLGMSFRGTDVKDESEPELRLLTKPLYITEPFLFLAANGDAIDIHKEHKVVQTIPLRRISEILVMEKALLSTALLRKCAEHKIPLTLTLNSGYFIATFKPDSKSYFELSYAHARKFYSLTDTAVLAIAKEFAAGKVRNYVALFRQKYRAGQNRFLFDLEGIVQRIYQAASLEETRGLEGLAARRIFQNLNDLMEDPAFHIQRRDRKNPDPINSLMNFGQYLLFSRINATVRAMGLNPYLGFLHLPEDDYESLVCDIQELFRARIDRLILRLINLKTITPKEFVETERGRYLTSQAAHKFLVEFEKEMEREATPKSLPLKMAIYGQVLILKKWITEDRSLTFYRWEV